MSKDQKKVIPIGIVLATLLLLGSSLIGETKGPTFIPVDAPAAVVSLDSLEPKNVPSLLPDKFRVRLQPKETLSGLFSRLLLDPREVISMTNSLPAAEKKRLKELSSRAYVYISLINGEQLQELIVMEGPIQGRRYYRNNDGEVAVATYQAKYTSEYKYREGTIKKGGSFIGTASRLDINANARKEFYGEIFAYDIDFAHDVRPGDSFSMLLEDIYVEGTRVQEDRIAVAEFVNKGKRIIAVRYTNDKGKVGYYTPKGESMASRFLRMPIELARIRISSKFNPSRRHPVLNIVRPHNGVDFAARPGTPIHTTGNGRVSFIGNNGGYGKTIIIDHGDGFTTLYAHMKGYAKGMRRGKVVKQRQVIGYVGTTGVSTGPHLHYEFRVRGKHKDPLKLKFDRSVKLDKEELPKFLKHSEELLTRYNQRLKDDNKLARKDSGLSLEGLDNLDKASQTQ